MDMKEKLVELIKRAKQSWSTSTMIPYDCTFESWIADHLIANGVTFAKDNNVTSKWISVKDRLPKPFTPVLVYRQSFGTLPPYIKVDKMTLWSDDTQVWTDEVGNWKNVTTHWMPLPEPPTEEAQPDCTYNQNGHCMGHKMMPECDAKNCDRRK